jgi:hypothetical protein
MKGGEGQGAHGATSYLHVLTGIIGGILRFLGEVPPNRSG